MAGYERLRPVFKGQAAALSQRIQTCESAGAVRQNEFRPLASSQAAADPGELLLFNGDEHKDQRRHFGSDTGRGIDGSSSPSKLLEIRLV